MTPREHLPSPEQLEREHKSLQLRLAGADYRTIAEQVGYASASSAMRAVHRVITRVPPEAYQVRELEAARLDRLQLAHWPKALQGDVHATNTVISIMRRRAELLGLDHRHGIAERRQALLEAEAADLIRDVTDGLDAADLTPEQRDVVLATMQARMEARATATDPDTIPGEVVNPTSSKEQT